MSKKKCCKKYKRKGRPCKNCPKLKGKKSNRLNIID